MVLFSKKIFFVIIFAIVVSLSYFSFPIVLDYFKPNTLESDEFKYTPFPTTKTAYRTGGQNEEWKMQLFQGIVNGYTQENGKDLVIVSYILANSENQKQVKVLLNIDEDQLPQDLDYKNDLVSKSLIEERLLNSISIYESLNDSTDPISENSAIFTTYENFQKTFGVGTSITFLLYSQFPSSEIITNEFCINSGYYPCIITELTRDLSGDMENFWNYDPNYEGILVPYEIYLEAIPEEL